MTVGDAKNIARQWVEEQKGQIDNFYGAFFSGSFNFMAEDDIWEDWSDIDVRIVVDGDPPAGIVHKRLLHRGIVFDAWYDRLAEWLKPEQLLSNSGMAYHFSVPNIISDPTGNLMKTQKAVEKEFAVIGWVKKRCDHARTKSESFLDRSIDEQKDDSDVFSRFWNLGLGLAWATGMPVLADLSVPTGRRSLCVLRKVLEKYKMPQLHAKLLKLMGHDRVNHSQAVSLLNQLSETFDQAIRLIPSDPAEDTYISEIGRSYAIDGSQQMIDEGDIREAVFFILCMLSLAHKEIQKYAIDEDKERYIQSYMKAMSTWDYSSEGDIIERAKEAKRILPEIMEIAEYIIENNPNIIK